MFKWDGHNEFWDGRITNYNAKYPGGLVGVIHTDGQIWSTCNMKIWDAIGRMKSDRAHFVGLSATNSATNQDDAAIAISLAAVDLGYSPDELSEIKRIYKDCGYSVSSDICGDGILGDDEECEGDIIGDAVCDTGCGSLIGKPICTSSCTLDYSVCTVDAGAVLSFEVDITFDSYPDETSWTVTDSNSNLVFSGGPYTGQSISEESCLDKQDCYTFTIFDSFDDGICCTFGNGSYSYSVDKIVFNPNPSFGSSASHTFGDC